MLGVPAFEKLVKEVHHSLDRTTLTISNCSNIAGLAVSTYALLSTLDCGFKLFPPFGGPTTLPGEDDIFTLDFTRPIVDELIEGRDCVNISSAQYKCTHHPLEKSTCRNKLEWYKVAVYSR
jgi:hypothetical protein